MHEDDTKSGSDTNSESSDTNRGPTRRAYLAGATLLGATALGGVGATRLAAGSQPTTFTVRVENVSESDTLQTTVDEQPVPLSPGAYAVHRRDEPIFSADEPERNDGLEEVAEDGMPSRLAQSLAGTDSVVDSGAFTTPVGASGPAPIGPGGAYEIDVEAEPPARYLSLVTMFVPSNDLFYSVGGPGGLELFDGNDPVEGDVTGMVALWDAGTEINEEPGVGENQVQRQRGPGVGLIERGTVAPIDEVNGYDYPATSDVIRVALAPDGG